MTTKTLTCALLLSGLAGCSRSTPAPAPPVSPPASAVAPFGFTDVTADSGIDMTLTSGGTPSTQILEVKGGGLALIDFDRDGDQDVFVPNGATLDAPDAGPGCRLFENLGGMTFRDVTEQAGLTFRRWGIGVTVADYDADGFDDLFVTCYGPDALLRNTGDGRFEDVAERAGVAGDGWSTAACFGDTDGDGDLDLYVVRYLGFDVTAPPPPSSFRGTPVLAGPKGLAPAADVFYENLGDGRFRVAGTAAGTDDVAPSYGLGVVILDVTGDGHADIFVGNDSMPNFLFVNDGTGVFANEAVRRGLATNADGSPQATMGIAIGDVDGNDAPDFFTTNFASDTNTLHLNNWRFFDDATQRFGLGMISRPFLGWACGLYDLDLDGDEDLLIFNGHVYPNASRETMDSDYLQPPLLFARRGPRFERVTGPPWLAQTWCDRSAAFGDLDGDGDVDVVVGELNGPVRVIRNDAAAGNWLTVSLEGPRLGAIVDVTTEAGSMRRWIHGGGSFLSASAQEAYFGLPGDAEAVEVQITRPDGIVQPAAEVPTRQRIVVR